MTTKPLSTLSRAELERREFASDKRMSALVDEFIAMGRGNERPSETALCTDGASRVYMQAMNEAQDISLEKSARMAYHGSLRPIRRAVAA